MKTWKSDVVVKTCCIREAKEQPSDLPFWLKIPQEKHLFTCPKPKRSKSLPTPSCVSLRIPGSSILSMAIPVN